MKISVTKQFLFDAAHFLEDYDGACSRMHGHTYKLEVTISGELEDDMIVDFGMMKKLIKPVVDKLDHYVLNEILDFNPTAERISEWFFIILRARFARHTVERVRLWETPTSYAEVTDEKLSDI